MIGDKARLKTNSKPFLHVSTHVQEKVGHSQIYDLAFISLAPLSQFVNELICIRASLDRMFYTFSTMYIVQSLWLRRVCYKNKGKARGNGEMHNWKKKKKKMTFSNFLTNQLPIVYPFALSVASCSKDATAFLAENKSDNRLNACPA
ncbi:hypothetical protein T01_2722 [Trichinella spiralis]|uniref:Uncharacterized protein n=1 Tax=Trichinella spiralis TaxID=6334 RepID=A0A0V1BI37_TRISP|nr:hypothetical protein T01_2722 [Trichinella spiralis]